jgi:DNA-binding response OmpR family regulator
MASEGTRFSLAIVDLTLPDISGETVVASLLESSEQIRVIISSGRPYTVEALPEAHRSRAAAILKPYLPQELIATIEALLGPGDQASIS